MSEQIFAIVSRRSGLSRDRLYERARLVEDIGLDGDDGSDMILEINRLFGTDISQFDESQYFRPEPKILGIFRPRLAPKKSLRIADLVRAAVDGQLR